jgi:DNA-binding PadR family transcriptional regulator
MLYSKRNTKPIWRNLLEVSPVTRMDSELLTQMNERIVKSFLDMLILKELKRGSLNDSQLANIFHKRFGEIVDFTLINSNLKFLEKEELITNGKDENRKVYTLTVRGDKKARAFLNSKNKILGLLLNLFI